MSTLPPRSEIFGRLEEVTTAEEIRVLLMVLVGAVESGFLPYGLTLAVVVIPLLMKWLLPRCLIASREV